MSNSQAIENRTIEIGLLDPHPANYNQHPASQVDRLGASLDKFGQPRSIVVQVQASGRYMLVAGHGVTLAAKELGWTGLRADVIPADWPAEKVSAYLAADNELARMADPDNAALASILEEANRFDPELLTAIGYDEAEFEALLREVSAGIEPPEDPGPQVDRAEELREKWGVEVGQLWQLGEHRLICGDCTDSAVVERVMQGEKAGAFITDLPYGSTGCAWDSIIDFSVLWEIYENNTNEMAAFVTTASQPFTSKLVSSRVEWFKHSWVWDKKLSGNFLQASRQPMKIHEDICVFAVGKFTYNPQMTKGRRRIKGGEGRSKLWDMDRTKKVNDDYFPVSILQFPNTDRTGKTHPTEKPIDLFSYIVETYTDLDDLVADFTVGSGTTLIACEQLGRKCRAVEIVPGYVAVALDRWTEMTGQTPELLDR